MTAPAPDPGRLVRTMDDVAKHVRADLVLGRPTRLGAELEWFAIDRSDPLTRPDPAAVSALLEGLGPLPGGSLLSTEPGGQVELSSAPYAGPQAAVAALESDLRLVRAALDEAGIDLLGLGADPARPPCRVVNAPRYAVMEAFFDAEGGSGRSMMCSTAAVQVSVDAGLAEEGLQSAAARWRRAHLIGPALVAAFASSPLLSGRVTGARSSRQRVWADVDPSRTSAPPATLGPVEALTQLAWSAQVLTVRDDDGTCRPAPPGLRFGQWATGAGPRRPTSADLAYHLTTLFPPVRARGWYEVRYLDALPDPLWQVAVATVAALLDDDAAALAAEQACSPVADRWRDAALHATSDPALAAAGTSCLLAAAEALPRMGAPALADAVGAYAERYAARGRCPADDLLDRLRKDPDPCALLRHPVPA